jgi:hypothetical protein
MTELTTTAKILSPVVFKKQSFPMLRNYGLVNVYIDDYGHKHKYENCLFYLFKPNLSANFLEFERKLANFVSFYDWYEVDDLKMYVFSINPLYGIDIVRFKQNQFTDFSEEFKEVIKDVNFSDVYFDLSKEIYRFSEHLTIKKGS